MPAQDPQNTAVPPTLPTAEALYDQIMGAIEPELMSAGIETLGEKYKDETPEAFAARKERYAKAFEEYDRKYQEYISSLQTQVREYRRQSFARVESNDRGGENQVMQNLEAAFAA